MALALLLVLAQGCNNAPEKATAEEKPAVAGDSLQSKKCYAHLSATDTITLVLNGPDSLVKGVLVYAFSGKDRNVGTIAGKFNHDTLFADYTFYSEGVESVREVAFLRTDSSMTEGFGPVTEKDKKMVFTNHQELTFGNQFFLSPQNCR
ncbi:hypothetical protein FPE01S_03_04860 [Flavihumibacter petaseus NBRC 106054]|uniref:Uncharacterized protein n=2 Tax=Flavihumibacter TaxID=1004301 RepID=A0A0E9N3R0_9BACT|nr:hypothetical protein FPE01S_03_04860 [Flavihumibacter petaseus NBRC 106054]